MDTASASFSWLPWSREKKPAFEKHFTWQPTVWNVYLCCLGECVVHWSEFHYQVPQISPSSHQPSKEVRTIFPLHTGRRSCPGSHRNKMLTAALARFRTDPGSTPLSPSWLLRNAAEDRTWGGAARLRKQLSQAEGTLSTWCKSLVILTFVQVVGWQAPVCLQKRG